MTCRISPSRLRGTVKAPPSKSMAHRLLIAAALADGESRITGIASSEDISATLDCLRAMGAKIMTSGDVATVHGFRPQASAGERMLPCRESGSTLRFLLPLCLLSGTPARLYGSERLFARPLSVYEEIAAREGHLFRREGASVTVAGRLRGGTYTVRGDISSQFITGLLYALPFTEGGGTVHLLPPVESRSYLDLTVEALAAFGVPCRWVDPLTLSVPPVRAFTPTDATVEGDYSNAAFFEALRLLGHDVGLTGLAEDSRQGDRIFFDYFHAIAAGCPTLSLADCPDLGPILMALAAALGGAVFTDTSRLAIKESDRGAAMAEELRKFGAEVINEQDKITVRGGGLHTPTSPLSGHNDHRIVMSLATLATVYGGVIEGADAVKKSLPEYFEMLTHLGAEVHYEAN